MVSGTTDEGNKGDLMACKVCDILNWLPKPFYYETILCDTQELVNKYKGEGG